jgi:hypothetical protein
VGSVAFPVVFLGAVEVDEDRQGPRARGEGEADEDREDDPLMAVASSGVGVRGPNGVPMTGLAVNRPPGVPVDGVVADQGHGTFGEKAVEQETNQATSQMEARPGRAGEDALVVGPVPGGEVPEGAEEVGDGASTRGQQGSDEQGGESLLGGAREVEAQEPYQVVSFRW